MAALYRKYRPQVFARVINQKHIIQTLKNQVQSDGFSHAYLFTGSRGVGKTSVARIVAKAVNCTNRKEGDACGACQNCRAIETGTFLDLVEIDAASNTGVDNIRELIEHVKFSPSVGKYKVFIIDEVHMLSKGAFNALLKTLEEPPKHAIFILATTEVNKVPPTVISRTQRFDFKACSISDLVILLKQISKEENMVFESGVLELVAQSAEGSARDALSLLDKIMSLGSGASLAECQQLLGVTDIAVCENLLTLIIAGNAKDLPNFFNQLAEMGLDYAILNRDFLEFLRKVLVAKISLLPNQLLQQDDHQAKIQNFADSLSVAELIYTIRLFLKAYKDLPFSPSPEIPLLLASIEAALRASKAQSVLEVGSGAFMSKSELGKPAAPMGRPPVKGPELSLELTENLPPAMSLAEVEQVWVKILDKIRAVNGPLASMLRAGRLESVNGNKILLGVKFLFDKQNLESSKNFALISACIEQVTGKKMSVFPRVIKPEVLAEGGAVEALTDALKIFGGELIE